MLEKRSKGHREVIKEASSHHGQGRVLAGQKQREMG
jgi:hypothetical protein